MATEPTPPNPKKPATPPVKRAAAEGETIDINKITGGKTLTSEEAEKVAARLARELGEDEDPPAKPATPATAKTTPGENGNGKTPPPAYSIPGVDNSSLDDILKELHTEKADASPEEVAAAIAAEVGEGEDALVPATPKAATAAPAHLSLTSFDDEHDGHTGITADPQEKARLLKAAEAQHASREEVEQIDLDPDVIRKDMEGRDADLVKDIETFLDEAGIKDAAIRYDPHADVGTRKDVRAFTIIVPESALNGTLAVFAFGDDAKKRIIGKKDKTKALLTILADDVAEALISKKARLPQVKKLFALLNKSAADCRYDDDAQMHTIRLSAPLMKAILDKNEKEAHVLPPGAWKDLLPVTRWKVPKEAMDTLLEKDETPESLIARLKAKPEFKEARITAAGNEYVFDNVPVAAERAALFSDPVLQKKIQKSKLCTLRIAKEKMDEILDIAYPDKTKAKAAAEASPAAPKEIPRLPPVKPASAFDERKLLEFLSTCYPEGCRVTYDAERKEFTVEAAAKTLLIAPLRDSGMTECETNENTRFEGGDTLKLHIAAAAVQRMHERAKTQPMRGIKPVNLPLKKAAIAPAVVDRRYETKQKLKKALGPGTRIADYGTGEDKGWEIAAAAPDPEDIRKILATLGIAGDVNIIPTGTTQWYAPKEFMDTFAPQTANLKPDYESWAHRSSQGAIQHKFDTELKSKGTEVIKNPTGGAHAYIIDNVTASTNVPLTKPPINTVPKFTFRLPEPVIKALIGQQPAAAAAAR